MEIDLTALLEGLTSTEDSPEIYYLPRFSVGDFTIDRFDPRTFKSFRYPWSHKEYAAKTRIEIGESRVMNPPEIYQAMDAMVTCFRLFQEGYMGISFGTGSVVGKENAGFPFGSPAHGPMGGMAYNLRKADVAKLEKFSEDIWPVITGKRHRSSIDTALRFFNRGIVDFARGDSEIAVIDFVSCLESLVSPGSELTHRIAENIAWITERNPTARSARYCDMKRIYRIRSEIVHGSEAKAEDLAQAMGISSQLARYCLRFSMGYYLKGFGKEDILSDLHKVLLGSCKEFPDYSFKFLQNDYNNLVLTNFRK